MKKTNVVKNTTCFSEHRKRDLKCQKSNCKFWHCDKATNNCAILAAEEGPMTLQQIGDKYNLTRMRICQLEKIALNKIFDLIGSD